MPSATALAFLMAAEMAGGLHERTSKRVVPPGGSSCKPKFLTGFLLDLAQSLLTLVIIDILVMETSGATWGEYAHCSVCVSGSASVAFSTAEASVSFSVFVVAGAAGAVLGVSV